MLRGRLWHATGAGATGHSSAPQALPSPRQLVAKMTPIVIIPARMAARRLPGKPLADIAGAPMIVRVLRQAEKSGVGEVAVAAGDPEIAAAVQAAGGRAVLTDPDLPS